MIVLRSPALDPVPSAEPRPDHDPELVTENPPGEITVRGAPEQADGTRAPSPRGAASPLTWTEIVTACPGATLCGSSVQELLERTTRPDPTSVKLVVPEGK